MPLVRFHYAIIPAPLLDCCRLDLSFASSIREFPPCVFRGIANLLLAYFYSLFDYNFNNYFTSIVPQLRRQHFSVNISNYFCLDPLFLSEDDQFKFHEVDIPSLIQIIGKIKKTYGSTYSITASLLSRHRHNFAYHLTYIINRCINEGVFLDKLKVGGI